MEDWDEGKWNLTSIQQWGNGTFNFVYRGYSRVVSALLPFRDIGKNVALVLFKHLLWEFVFCEIIPHSIKLSSRRAKTDVVRLVKR